MIQDLTVENDALISHSLVEHKKNDQNVNRKNVVSHTDCKIFYHKTISLLSGHFKDDTQTYALCVYQLDTKIPSWE